jgi:hypothetical protein
MTDQHRSPESNGLPRWVKVVGIVVIVVALLFVAMMLIGGPGGHGPSRHGGSGSQAPVQYGAQRR